MRKFLIRLFVFFLLMVACDVAMGLVGNYLIAHAKGGNTKRKNYIVCGTNEDVLIFGSSRAFLHYDPNVFEDVLSMSAYNCGFIGHGIIFAYGYFHMVMSHYTPKVVVYEVTPVFDLLEGDNHTYLGELRYYYDREGVDSIFWSVDKTERYKMLSRMYRYNSMLPSLFMDNLHPSHSDNKGFHAVDKEMSENIKPMESQTSFECDSLKLYYLERMINDCKGKTLLVFAVSPMYENANDEVLAPIKVLCEEYGVPLLNHYTDTAFNYTREYFSDRTHLNRTGATEYSKVVAGEIKRLIEQQ